MIFAHSVRVVRVGKGISLPADANVDQLMALTAKNKKYASDDYGRES